MNPITLGAAAGAAALTVGTGALRAASSGLSFAAELARAASGSRSAEGPPDSSQALQQAVADLRRRIELRLAESGIQLSQPVELVSNGLGGIAVAGPHPQQALIEEALGSDVLLERDFNQLAQQYAEQSQRSADVSLPPELTLEVSAASSGR